MFVVCPSCAGPFRIPADQIAPLVQIACPHCEFRMILDFEAANDPSLVESGHLMAQGFENAEQYFSVYSHIGSQPDARPRRVEAPVAAEAPTPVKPEPRVEAPVQPKAAPTTPAPQPVSTTQQQRPLARPTSEPQPVAAASQSQAPVSRGSKTIIQTPKKPASMEGQSPLEPRAKVPSGPTMRAGRGSEMVTEPATPAIEAKVTAVEPEAPSRLPPHTPPAATAVSNAPSTPEPVATTRPEDIAAMSGTHPSKPEPAATPEVKAASEPTKEPTTPEAVGEKRPPQPTETGGSNSIFIIIVLVVLIAAAAAIYLGTRS